MVDTHDTNKFDQTPVTGTDLKDLDLQEVERHLDYAIRTNRYAGEARDVLEFLVEQRAAVKDGLGIKPTIAGLLVFGRWPQRYLPHATVTLAHYRGNEINSGDVIHIHEYTGNVPQQIDRVIAYLSESMKHGYALEGGAQRQEKPQYPVLALRELTVNAVAHRDYTIEESAVRVTMFRNQIEWTSPGRLPEGVTIETILEHQFARNKNLLRLLYQRSYVEKIGQGLDTVFDECRKLELDVPTMRETGAAFIIRIQGHELLGASQARLKLTDVQLQIVTLLKKQGSMNAQEITDALRDDFKQPRSLRTVQVDLKTLVDAGIVDRLGQTRASTYILHSL
jgi:ATP-dependent DNA helicase RecG